MPKYATLAHTGILYIYNPHMPAVSKHPSSISNAANPVRSLPIPPHASFSISFSLALFSLPKRLRRLPHFRTHFHTHLPIT